MSVPASLTPELGDSITISQLETDPYPLFARLRRQDPFTWVPVADAWFVTRWDDYEQLYSSSDYVNALSPFNPSEAVLGSPNILTTEGPLHTELRSSLHEALLPKTVNGYVEDLARPFVKAGLDRLRGRETADLIRDFYEPISVMCTAELLGMGEIDPELLRRWFREMADGAANHERDREKHQIALAAVLQARHALDDIFERVERHPDGSLISELLHRGMPGSTTRDRDLITPTILVILLGGLQEPGHGAGNITHALLRHPDQWQAVTDDPSRLLARAVNEGLRWEPPAGTIEKCAQQDFVFHDRQVRAGENLVLLNSSVNRDESHFVRSEDFNILRRESKHHAFGMGHHVCMGHWFARRVIMLAMSGLIAEHPRLRFDPDINSELRGWVFRGPKDGLFVRLSG